MKPFFSIIVPIADNTSPDVIERFKKNIRKQTYKSYELILIVSQYADPGLIKNLRANRNIKTFFKDLTKSQARNFGASKAKGNYLVHIDINDRPEKETLAECAELISKNGALAITMHENVRGINFISRIRRLERKFNKYDLNLASPQIIQTSLFKKIGGFDQRVDILDDWSLQFRLKKKGILFYQTKAENYIEIESDIVDIFKRKYIRGRFVPAFTQIYPNYSKISNSERLNVYIKNFKYFFSDPLAAFGLFFLKPIEWLTWFLGTLNPINQPLTYEFSQTAQYYNKETSSSNYNLYKNYCEERALKILTANLPKNVLEIGSGTGRITKFLIKAGFRVTPAEPSVAMISEYLKDKSLPKPINVGGQDLDLSDKYDIVLGIRVIWHVRNKYIRDKIFANAAEHSKDVVIFDLTNRERWFSPLLFFASGDHFYSKSEIGNLMDKYQIKESQRLPLDLLVPFWLNFIPEKSAAHLFPKLYDLEIRLSKYIPPGRWIISFKKISS